MSYQIFFVVLLCGLASAQEKAISFESCGGSVIEVRANPCSSEPCSFHKGDETKIEIDFTSNQDTANLKLSVTARVFGFEASFPGMEGGADGCIGGGISCPIKSGQKLTFKTSLAVPKYAPSLKTTATFKAEGDDGVVFCFKAPVQIN